MVRAVSVGGDAHFGVVEGNPCKGFDGLGSGMAFDAEDQLPLAWLGVEELENTNFIIQHVPKESKWFCYVVVGFGLSSVRCSQHYCQFVISHLRPAIQHTDDNAVHWIDGEGMLPVQTCAEVGLLVDSVRCWSLPCPSEGC